MTLQLLALSALWSSSGCSVWMSVGGALVVVYRICRLVILSIGHCNGARDAAVGRHSACRNIRCSAMGAHSDAFVYSLLSMLAVLSQELGSGLHGKAARRSPGGRHEQSSGRR